MNQMPNQDCILAFVSDLYFTVRISSVADRLGFEVIWIEKIEDIGKHQSKFQNRKSQAFTKGIKSDLLDCISRWKPNLIIFDLNNNTIPWMDWINLISSDPATRRIPIVCFSSHKDVTAIDRAKRLGAKAVFARSRFVTNLPNIIHKSAILPDIEGMKLSCQRPLTANGVVGIEKFNQGNYFDAHEFLELAWMEDETIGRNLYRALLQVAVAYYQIRRTNYQGAFKMFLRLRKWLDVLPDRCQGVNVAKLRAEVDLVYNKLIELGPEKISEFEHQLLKPIELEEF
jgi:uncharacterized protein